MLKLIDALCLIKTKKWYAPTIRFKKSEWQTNRRLEKTKLESTSPRRRKKKKLTTKKKRPKYKQQLKCSLEVKIRVIVSRKFDGGRITPFSVYTFAGRWYKCWTTCVLWYVMLTDSWLYFIANDFWQSKSFVSLLSSLSSILFNSISFVVFVLTNAI